MACWAIIAVNAPDRCKSRLAGVLTARERQLLAERMLRRVVHAARCATRLDGVSIVSPTRRPWAARLSHIADEGRGLNAAVALALAALRKRRLDAAVILSADLPELTSSDIDDLIVAGRSAGIAVAPDRYARGTNAVYTRLDVAFEPRFGAGSFAAHIAAARVAGILPAVVTSAGLARDVDVPHELWSAPGLLASPAPSLLEALANG